MCLPFGADAKDILDKVGSALGSSTTDLEKYISDLKTAWATILGSVGAAFIIALIYMIVLRYCSGLITWLSILLFFAGIIAFAILLLQKGNEKETEVKNTCLICLKIE